MYNYENSLSECWNVNKIINLEGQKMYRYFLGAFGNKSFIRPQYEIMEDGKLRGIEDRWGEFPNGGTVSLTGISDSDTESIKNRLLQFKIDFNRDLHPGYAPYTDNSNKYQIPFKAIDDFDKDEVVEIIDIDYAIEDFINDKTKRTIRIKHRPNKQILLRYAQDCYGPFEFMISDIEDSYGDESYYTIKVFVNSGTINRYRNSDIEKIIMDGYFSIRRNDRIEFIYNISDLKAIEPEEKIEYIDNEELADFFKTLLNKSSEIDNLAGIREQFLELADSFSEEGQLTDNRIKRICELLQTSVDLSDYKVRLTEEYFKNNQYIFEGNGYEITLLYEPSIWIDRSNACTNLYSTGYNFIKSKWNDRWTPDFVLKISGNYKDYYYILDAKYSNFYNVKRRYIPALVLKYGTQIASKDKFFSDVIGIGAIYPSKEDKIYYFKKNAINSLKHSLPQYFSLTIVDGDVGTQILKEQIEKLFKVVDILEEECENIDSSKKEMSLNNFEIEHEKIENEPKTEVEKKEENDSLNINVSGKNCFYYAKNICLCQKKPCTVINAPCKHYIPKKSRELLKEDSCRNLIQYVKRNKPNGRVECSISGLPGCIGAEQCKFYLKKHVHK